MSLLCIASYTSVLLFVFPAGFIQKLIIYNFHRLQTMVKKNAVQVKVLWSLPVDMVAKRPLQPKTLAKRKASFKLHILLKHDFHLFRI